MPGAFLNIRVRQRDDKAGRRRQATVTRESLGVFRRLEPRVRRAPRPRLPSPPPAQPPGGDRAGAPPASPRPATYCSAGHRTAARGCPLAAAFPLSRAAVRPGPGDTAPASRASFSAQLEPNQAPGWGMVPRLMGPPRTAAGPRRVSASERSGAPLVGAPGRGRRRRSAARRLPWLPRALPRASPPPAPRPLTPTEGARPVRAERPGGGACACAAERDVEAPDAASPTRMLRALEPPLCRRACGPPSFSRGSRAAPGEEDGRTGSPAGRVPGDKKEGWRPRGGGR